MVVDQGFLPIQHIFQCFGILFEKQDVIHCLFQPPGARIDFSLLIGMGSSQLAPFLLPDSDFGLGYLDHLKLRCLFPHFTKLSKLYYNSWTAFSQEAENPGLQFFKPASLCPSPAI